MNSVEPSSWLKYTINIDSEKVLWRKVEKDFRTSIPYWDREVCLKIEKETETRYCGTLRSEKKRLGTFCIMDLQVIYISELKDVGKPSMNSAYS